MKLRMQAAAIVFQVTVAAFFCSPASSSPLTALHLQFHIGASSGGTSFVGGTIFNAGVSDLSGGFIAVSFFSEDCQYSGSAMYSFLDIPSDKIHSFKIPVNFSLSRYQISSLIAYDSVGRSVKFIDDNSSATEKLQHEAIDKCMDRSKNPS